MFAHNTWPSWRIACNCDINRRRQNVSGGCGHGSRLPNRRVAIAGLIAGFGALMQACATSRSELGLASLIRTSLYDVKSKGKEMLTLRAIAGPEGQLAVDDTGVGGLPVLFVHADSGNSIKWREALNHVRLRRRAIALDLRGHRPNRRTGTCRSAGRSADIAAGGLAQLRCAALIDAVHGKHVLGQIDTNSQNSHGLPLPSELMNELHFPSWHSLPVAALRL